jgi:hypothetical protein
VAILDPAASRVFQQLLDIPELASVLNSRMVRLRVYNAIARDIKAISDETAKALREAENAAERLTKALSQVHTEADCRAALASRGYRIIKPTEAESAIPETPTFGEDSQTGKLLQAFGNAGPDGLTDDVAARNAMLEGAASPWRRASTLRELGMIAPLLDENGNRITRKGLRGSMRMVSAITDYGMLYLTSSWSAGA